MRIQWLLLLVAIVLGLGFWAWRSLAPMEVSVVTVERGKAIEAVYASGIVRSDDQAEIGSVVAGRVVEVLVEEGQSITRGQPLARLDDSKIRQSLTDAQSRLEWAEKEAARAKSLLREGTGARQAYEKAQTELITAQTDLAVQQQALADLTISAPADGIVQRKDVEVGQSVAAQKALFITGALGRLVAKLDVDERDIPACAWARTSPCRPKPSPQSRSRPSSRWCARAATTRRVAIASKWPCLPPRALCLA